ncbi:fimbria/pilus periplasmic chaperone [Klebsiella sp. BIGb0407]|uniref:fimbria/pilus periplasmic chaperone n=1 Tax=Klebsiella sp. BIGb0407 TaxID=2940603 RepID=UPI00216A0627|nr:fimbria/pilus periplasmic chaperone [Klebsiella sp. BIGb0407]
MHSYKFLLVFNKLTRNITLFCLPFLCCITHSFAVVNVEGTRAVFNSGDNVISMRLVNSGNEPSVVQIWTDDGDPLANPQDSRTPVIALPPVFSIQPGEIKSVKLQLVSPDKILKDRESLYWLNIYQIPPRSKTDDAEQHVFLPLRFRLKVFVRPENIPVLEEEDGKKLNFSVIRVNDKETLAIKNPTPWHMNIGELNIDGEVFGGLVVSPYSDGQVTLSDRSKRANSIQYSIINDDGNKWFYP